MAHTKSGGSTKLGRESASQRLGVKRQDNQMVKTGEVLIRQRGTKYLAGLNVGMGKDDTLYALKTGAVKFTSKIKTKFDGKKRSVKVVNVIKK
ncbi:MAG: 50S ribosomal protein L27 [Spirochaetota bacterium]